MIYGSARAHAEDAAELLERAKDLRAEYGPGSPGRHDQALNLEQRAQAYALTAIALMQTQGEFS